MLHCLMEAIIAEKELLPICEKCKNICGFRWMGNGGVFPSRHMLVMPQVVCLKRTSLLNAYCRTAL